MAAELQVRLSAQATLTASIKDNYSADPEALRRLAKALKIIADACDKAIAGAK